MQKVIASMEQGSGLLAETASAGEIEYLTNLKLRSMVR
jgi:hypothetical protein